MLNLVRNACNYVKYGKIIYESSNGSVIRRKSNIKNGVVKTTKTFLDANGQVSEQMNRRAYVGKSWVPSESCFVSRVSRTKNSEILSEKEYQIHKGTRANIINNPIYLIGYGAYGKGFKHGTNNSIPKFIQNV